MPPCSYVSAINMNEILGQHSGEKIWQVNVKLVNFRFFNFFAQKICCRPSRCLHGDTHVGNSLGNKQAVNIRML